MKNKLGITMVILVATVAIAVVIMSVSVIAIRNSIKNAEIVAVTQEFTTIQKAVEEYYLLNGDLPFADDMKYSSSEISMFSSNAAEFLSETTINKENDNAIFVKIDMSKIGIERTIRGNEQLVLESNNDFYVVAYPSLNVYYVAGVKIDGVYYFSLAKLDRTQNVNAENIQQNAEEEYISGDLSVMKKKSMWTNKMNLEISTYISSVNQLIVSIPDGSGGTIEKNVLTSPNSTNVIELNDLTDIGFSASESQLFKEIDQSLKKITVIKKENNDIVGKVEVDLSNYETTVPVIGDSIVRRSYPEYNEFIFDVSDSLSGVDSLKYEYYEKRTINSNSLANDDLDVYQIQNIIKNGKEAKVENNRVTIKIPKNIVSIKYVVSDKAGNLTDVLTLDTKYPIFIGYSTVSGTVNTITFDISIEASDAITSVKTYISNDGKNFESEYNHGSVVNINNFTYLDISNMYDYLFIKVVVETGGITEVRIIQVDVSNFTDEGTTNKSKVAWNKPYIPDGFAHTEGTVLTGYVIQDITNTSNKYNEFVWIPVDYIYENTTLSKGTDTNITKLENLITGWQYGTTQSTVDTLSNTVLQKNNVSEENTEYANLIESIETYGGFYVGRYEAGDYSAIEARSSSSLSTNKAVCKKGAYVYNYIGWSDDTNVATQNGGAVELCRNMYVDNSNIASCLIYGCQYDAILHFINLSNINVSSSATYGNYTSTLIKTGSNESNKLLNIYDLAGNVSEWTMEYNSSTARIVRGGAITSNGDANPISYRVGSTPDTSSNLIGFRPVLYIK